MFKNLDPLDITKKPFKTFKNFTFTNNDSGSGVFLVKARSGSFQRYVSGSDAITSIVSGSTTTRYFGLPTWNMINKVFYKDSDKPYRTFGNNNPNVEHRELHISSSIISVARNLYGEQIKPKSVDLDITIGTTTFTIKDDGDGNLYDNAHSASFASYKSSSFSRTPVASNGSGKCFLFTRFNRINRYRFIYTRRYKLYFKVSSTTNSL